VTFGASLPSDDVEADDGASVEVAGSGTVSPETPHPARSTRTEPGR
jgi:hypothetical protein